MKRKYVIKILLLILAYAAGYSLNSLLFIVINEMHLFYETTPYDHKLRKLDHDFLATGDKYKLDLLEECYSFASSPTGDELLLDYIIAVNKYKIEGQASKIYTIIVPQFVEAMIPGYKPGKFEEKYLNAAYTYNNIGCEFLYSAAKFGDFDAIYRIKNNIADGRSFYDEKLDSFPRIHKDVEEMLFDITYKNSNKDSIKYKK